MPKDVRLLESQTKGLHHVLKVGQLLVSFMPQSSMWDQTEVGLQLKSHFAWLLSQSATLTPCQCPLESTASINLLLENSCLWFGI